MRPCLVPDTVHTRTTLQKLAPPINYSSSNSSRRTRYTALHLSAQEHIHKYAAHDCKLAVRDQHERTSIGKTRSNTETPRFTWKTLQCEGKNHGPASRQTSLFRGVFTMIVTSRAAAYKRISEVRSAQASRRRAFASLVNLAIFTEFGSPIQQ